MRNVVFLIIAALVAAGGYGYYKNPEGCQKLGRDVASDVMAIVTAPGPGSSDRDMLPAPVAEAPSNPMEGNLLQNGDFSAGAKSWDGDFTTDPSVGKALIVTLNSNSWTKIVQNFKGKGTTDTVVVTYTVSPGFSPSNKAEDFTNVANLIQFEDYQRFGPFNLPTGDSLVWVGDLTNHQSRYEPFLGRTSPSQTHSFVHTFPPGAPMVDKMITLAFPPGAGKVTVLSVSVKSN